MEKTDSDEVIRVCSMEILNSDAEWQSFLALKALVQTLAKIGLYTHSLQNEHTHSDETLLCRIVLLVQSIEQNKYGKIMSPFRVNDERPEALIALKCFPKQHQHLRCPR